MKFRNKSAGLWGCPRMSDRAGQWLIDWFDESGSIEAVTVPSRDELAWITTNPVEVQNMQAAVEVWRNRRLMDDPAVIQALRNYRAMREGRL